MKTTTPFLLLFLIFLSYTLSAQDTSDSFQRKGRILVETGYSLTTTFLGGSTGASVLLVDGESVTTLGINGGYFISEDFAIKGRVGLINSGESIFSFSVGAKYYINGNIPVELNGGLFSLPDFFSGRESIFQANGIIGYGIKLAPNINLEPSFGILLIDGEANTQFGVTFAMFL